jgi:hypothetical protein
VLDRSAARARHADQLGGQEPLERHLASSEGSC